MRQEKIAVIGLGYVGLPIAASLSKKYDFVLGFDISEPRIAELKQDIDRTQELTTEALQKANIQFSCEVEDLKACNFFIVTVPTPIDNNKQPDLTPLKKASEMLGKVISKDSVVVYESTVYPGVTEEYCGPILAEVSGLQQSVDFKLGYSPERINPGDKLHTIEKIVKVVSGEDAETLERVANVYGSIIEAGIHKAESIQVAEAAKVIENVQRDLNIALMNELAIIFDRMGIRTKDVLRAAGTKWNFLPFTPGLVGGHCIGVDPYYLTAKAQMLGYHPHIILSGRRINDSMGEFVANQAIKGLIRSEVNVKSARIGVLGLTFKENVPDLRNSKVPDILRELNEFGVQPILHDPLADNDEAFHEYGVKLSPWEEFSSLDVLILAVNHKEYLEQGVGELLKTLRPGGLFMDVKSAIEPSEIGNEHKYWSL